MTILLLRGQQSAGEIRQRTERLHNFRSLDEVEETLSEFIEWHGQDWLQLRGEFPDHPLITGGDYN